MQSEIRSEIISLTNRRLDNIDIVVVLGAWAAAVVA